MRDFAPVRSGMGSLRRPDCPRARARLRLRTAKPLARGVAMEYRITPGRLEIGKFSLYYERVGAGAPIVFLHDLGAMLDHLEIDRAVLIGQSMGGWTIVGYALEHPERVAAMVLADTPGGIFTPEMKFTRPREP